MTGFRSGFGMIIYILIFCGLVLEKKTSWAGDVAQISALA